jgi:ribosomal protein L19
MTRSALAGWIGAACLALGCGGGEPSAPDAAASAALAPAPREPNRPPQIERVRLEPAEPMPGDRVRAVASVRDPDGDRVTQEFRWELAGFELPASGAEIELRAAAKGDPLEVRVTASDGRAESEPARAATRVANRRPVLENVALQPIGSVLPGEPAVATPLARDPDGDAVDFRFRWTVNQAPVEEQQQATFATAGLAPGDEIRVQVVASDGESESDAVWSGVLLVGNAAPEIVSTPAAVAPGQPFRYRVEARDPEGDKSLRYQLRKGPEGMSLNPILGDVHWQPRRDQTGVHPVEIAVEDAHGARAVQTFELSVGSPAAAPPAAPAE